MEFDQKFYAKKFDGELTFEEHKFDLTKSRLSVEDSLRIQEMYDEIGEKNYYRLRLAAIGYDLDTRERSYKYAFKQMVAGRIISVLSLDVTAKDKSTIHNPTNTMYFKGNITPFILKLSS